MAKIPDGAGKLFSGVLSDVLDGLGLYGQVGSARLRLIDETSPVVGYARTARAVPVSEPPAEPYSRLLSVIDSLSTADVLVISAPSTSTSSLFGGLLATAVTQSSGAGAIVDGFIRDTRELRSIGLPTAARGVSPLDSYGRDEVVEIGAPVAVGDVLVREGDFVLCDQDGMVVVPADVTLKVIALALEKVGREKVMRSALQDGMSVARAFQHFGVL